VPSPAATPKNGSWAKNSVTSARSLCVLHTLTDSGALTSQSFTESFSRLLLRPGNSERLRACLSEYALIFQDWTLCAVPVISNLQTHEIGFLEEWSICLKLFRLLHIKDFWAETTLLRQRCISTPNSSKLCSYFSGPQWKWFTKISVNVVWM